MYGSASGSLFCRMGYLFILVKVHFLCKLLEVYNIVVSNSVNLPTSSFFKIAFAILRLLNYHVCLRGGSVNFHDDPYLILTG